MPEAGRPCVLLLIGGAAGDESMTTRQRVALLLTLAASVALLASCNFPRQPSPQELAATAAAETVSAQLTQLSLVSPTLPPTNTPAPPPATNTPTPPPPPPPTATPGCTDESQFVSDVSIPDNTLMTPGQNLTKTWRLRNSGSCNWTTSYDAVFTDGNAMGGAASIPLTASVPPNSTVDISVSMSAPSNNGTFRATYRLRNANDVLFGTLFYVQIVIGPTPTPTVVVYRTGTLTIDDDDMADLDDGDITSSSDADVWLHEVSASERYLDPENGAELREMSGTPSYDDCADADLSSGQVNFNDFGEGSWFCYVTSDDRYGRFEVEDEDSDSITIDFRTWK
jgi:hypothetical protein